MGDSLGSIVGLRDGFLVGTEVQYGRCQRYPQLFNVSKMLLDLHTDGSLVGTGVGALLGRRVGSWLVVRREVIRTAEQQADAEL